jgi:hypothetical protein
MFAIVERLVKRYRGWQERRHDAWLREVIARGRDPIRKRQRELECERDYGRLILTEDGFRLDKRGKCKYAIRWNDVLEIQTYKKAFSAFDMIVLFFSTGQEWVEAWELMPGFDAVAEKMKESFLDMPADWYEVVAIPPYAQNQRTLWTSTRANQSSEAPHA